MGMLDGKVAIITGGGGGIGRGVARRFVREGAAVVVAEINDEFRQQIQTELVDELGGRAVVMKADVRKKADVLAAVQAAVDTFGGLDILVNNAFSLTPRVLLEHKTDEMLDSTLHSGVWAAWWGMQAARPHMIARGGGSIINFYSIDAEVGAWLNGDYVITKSALRGLTRSAANEWGRFNIRANLIAPTAMGNVFKMLAAQIPGFAEHAAAMAPLGRNGDPEDDIAPAIVFLASDLSRYVTGELLHVDGGLHMPGYDSKPQNLADLEGGATG